MIRNRQNEEVTLLGFVRHEILHLYGSTFIFGIEVPLSTFVIVTCLLTLLQTTFLMLKTKRCRFVMAKKLQRRCFVKFGCTFLGGFMTQLFRSTCLISFS